MSKFMSNEYLLENKKACELYKYVKNLPIFDYHCHLSPQEIFENKTYYTLKELWLDSDHYKWRLMRNFGVSEELVTGDGSPYNKFYAFASALPSFIGNPVYHWTQLELKLYFNITKPLSSNTAKEIWEESLKLMEDGSFSARNLIEKSKVTALITTDDPIDDLKFHKKLLAEDISFKVLPCFRPDRIINIDKDGFYDYVNKLASTSNIKITDLESLTSAIENRLKFFIINGCVAADCSFTNFPNANGDDKLANVALKKVLNKKSLDQSEINEYKFAIIKVLALLFSKNDMVMQIHTGVLRNQNTRAFNNIGSDSGIDSVGNTLDIEAGGKLFDAIEVNGGLPKTIVYTLNPNSYYTLATMIGDFAIDGCRGKMQLGAAWWFLDHKDGIKEQLSIYAATNGLGLFNGMLTDSRSFVSYARHDYFRRILCTVVGNWIENGEYPDEEVYVKELVQNICYFNSINYFGLIKNTNL